MPIFEFICTECERPFEELLRSTAAVEEVTCPNCDSSQVKKKLSTFAARINGGGASSFNLSSSACSTGGT